MASDPAASSDSSASDDSATPDDTAPGDSAELGESAAPGDSTVPGDSVAHGDSNTPDDPAVSDDSTAPACAFRLRCCSICAFRLACCCLARAVPAAGARPPRRAALALLPLVPRTRTRPSLALAGRFPAVLSFCLLRIAPRAAPARMQFSCASTDDRRTNDATCGPQEWLTGSLHDGGIRSVRSPLRLSLIHI